MTIHASIDNNPIKLKGIINVRSHNDSKIVKIYDRFFKDNQTFDKAIIDDRSRPMYTLETDFDANEYLNNHIKYSKQRGITGKMKIIVPSLQYKI